MSSDNSRKLSLPAEIAIAARAVVRLWPLFPRVSNPKLSRSKVGEIGEWFDAVARLPFAALEGAVKTPLPPDSLKRSGLRANVLAAMNVEPDEQTSALVEKVLKLGKVPISRWFDAAVTNAVAATLEVARNPSEVHEHATEAVRHAGESDAAAEHAEREILADRAFAESLEGISNGDSAPADAVIRIVSRPLWTTVLPPELERAWSETWRKWEEFASSIHRADLIASYSRYCTEGFSATDLPGVFQAVRVEKSDPATLVRRLHAAACADPRWTSIMGAGPVKPEDVGLLAALARGDLSVPVVDDEIAPDPLWSAWFVELRLPMLQEHARRQAESGTLSV